MQFHRMPAFQSGQLASAEALNTLLANADFLLWQEAWGLPAFRVAIDTWDGWMRHWGSHLNYAIRTESPAGGSSFQIAIEVPVDSGTWADVISVGGLVHQRTYRGSVSLTGSGLVKGTFYRVRVRKTGTVTLEVNRLFQTGSADRAWTAPASVANGLVWTAAEFNRLRSNIFYLYDLLACGRPPTHATLSMALGNGGLSGSDESRNPSATAWRGFTQLRGADWLAYQIGGRGASRADTSGALLNAGLVRKDETTDPPTLVATSGVGVYYNAFFTTYAWGDDPPLGDINDNLAGTFQVGGYFNGQPMEVLPKLARIGTSTDAVPAAGFPLVGIPREEWVEVRVARHDGNGESYDGAIQLVQAVRGAPDLTGWQAVAPFAHGEYLDGTAGQKLDALVDNLALLRSRIEGFPLLLPAQGPDLYFYHGAGPILRWIGSNVILHWIKGVWPKRGLKEQTLSLGTSGEWAAFDLRGADGLVPGGMYYLSGDTNLCGLEVFEDAED